MTPLYVHKFPYGSLIYAGGGIKTAKEFFMKKVLVLFIVGVVFFGACSAQNANAQNANIAQRIIGTWVDQDEDTWVFNANGTLTYDRIEFKFAVIDTKLAITGTDKGIIPPIHMSVIFNISMSSDGRTLFLEHSSSSSDYYRSNTPDFLWLTKR